MFYQGTLQDGISTAVGQQKLVLCFVTDDSEEGQQWETEFLPDETLSDLIKDHAIALRLMAGSEEAGYLAQIFPLPRTPTVVIIKNGDLKEYITPGTSKEEFVRRVQSVFNSTTSSSAATQPAPPSTTTATTQPEPPAAAPPADGPQPSTSETVRRILAERAARLQEQREEAQRKAKEERAKAKAEAEAKATTAMDKDNVIAHKAAEAVRKRKQQDQEERARILKRIADDKEERRMRAEERQKQRAETTTTTEDTAAPVPATKLPSMTKAGSGMTALQVRLFDGSTLRSRFKSGTSLKEVRGWVDESRTDGKQPYTFKQVLTPLPNKNIDETEEDKAIGDLGLSPSSTLVLIPVKKYVSAYDASGSNVFTRFFYFILGLFTWFFGLFWSREERGSREAAVGDDAPASPRDESRIRAFQNQQRDQQLYNGNSLNFEPRPDEEEKDA